MATSDDFEPRFGALKRVEAAEFCRVSPSTFYRIGPPADVSRGKVRLWTRATLEKWLSGSSGRGGKRVRSGGR
jgi:hypothetical protein